MVPITGQAPVQALQAQQPQSSVKLMQMNQIKPEEEHLYMNQNQLLISGANQQIMSQMHYRPNSVVYDR